MSYVLLDDGSGKSVGNGDGRVNKGESVDLKILLVNKAKTKLTNGRITMRMLTSSPGVRLTREISFSFPPN